GRGQSGACRRSGPSFRARHKPNRGLVARRYLTTATSQAKAPVPLMNRPRSGTPGPWSSRLIFGTSDRIVHVEFDRVRRHFEAQNLGHLQLDIGVDLVVVE